jgi:hypothetical protein
MYFEGAVFFFIFAAGFKTVVVAQLVRASDCDSEGRGFEPPRLPTKRFPEKEAFLFWNSI